MNRTAGAHAVRRGLDEFLGTLSDARNEATLRAAVAPLFAGAVRAGSIVICGFGALGGVVLEIARRANLRVAAITDNDPRKWTESAEPGIPVMSPADAVGRFGRDIPFVIAVYGSEAPRAQIEALGAARIVTYPAFCWAYPEHAPRFMGFETPAWIYARRDRLREAFAALGDDDSRREFASQIGWRCTLDRSLLAAPREASGMYFDRDVYRIGAAETLLDCGAYDGDTVRAFLARSGGAFRHIHALEPDGGNRERLEAWKDALPPDLRRRISILPYAVGERDELVEFGAGHGVGSRMGDAALPRNGPEPAARIECRRIDTLDVGDATIIKMDIEGAELGALRGARETIADARPVIALSSYHFTDHLWEIPLLLRDLAPDYRVSLRRYAAECWEMACYGVPPERSAPP